MEYAKIKPVFPGEKMFYGKLINKQYPGRFIDVGVNCNHAVYPDGYIGEVPACHVEAFKHALVTIPAPGDVKEGEKRAIITMERFLFVPMERPVEEEKKSKKKSPIIDEDVE